MEEKSTVELHLDRQVQTDIFEREDKDNYDYGFAHRSLSDQEILLLDLNSYSGYIRQATLERLVGNFEPELFPHLLNRLSDYVLINRQLAVDHLLRWSGDPEFSKLCVLHFLEIATLAKRERTDQTALNLILEKIAKNQKGLRNTLTQQQGQLPRVLLNFIIEYQWIENSQLLELCKTAKDQKVRGYWLADIILKQPNHELMAELKQTDFREVKYRLFDVLYRRNVLDNNDLVELWHSRFLSVMDYAYFALRQNNFDFALYFSRYGTQGLTQSQLRIRAYQYVMIKADIKEFYKILNELTDQRAVHALMCHALRQQYIQMKDYLNFYQENGTNLEAYLLAKARKSYAHALNLDELSQYLNLHKKEVMFKHRLEWVEKASVWDQLYWYVIQFSNIHTIEDQLYFEEAKNLLITKIKYVTQPPIWSQNQMNIFLQHLPIFIQIFPQLLQNQKIRQIFKKKLNVYDIED